MARMSFSDFTTCWTRTIRPYRRSLSTYAALDNWIGEIAKKQIILEDVLSPTKLSDLFITLPIRHGGPRSYTAPQLGSTLGYGHHLAFCHPRNREDQLRSDGTDADFCPPEPFVRRMWAGGKMTWKKPLLVGDKVSSTWSVIGVEKKGFEKGKPMVFVKQKVAFRKEGEDGVAIEEERVHAYLPVDAEVKRDVREVKEEHCLRCAFRYTPTPTTLFRFSALTFNGHAIHLDKEYAQREGYPERLVHGPLTALLLLENQSLQNPEAVFKTFEYRATNPVIVNKTIYLLAGWEIEKKVNLWCKDEDGVVGMVGKVVLESATDQAVSDKSP